MIAFGCSISEPEPYARYTEPGIMLAREPDSPILPVAAVGTIGRSLNVLLDLARKVEDLEALVILHPHTQIDDPDLCAKLREAFADPDVAIVGQAGSSGAQTIAWWEGRVTCSRSIHHYTEYEGGDIPAYSWAATEPAPGEVETVDGTLIALSPWAVENLRFDEGLVFGHGFELDLCLRAREAGRKVVAADIRVIHHTSLEIVSDLEQWTEAHIQFARKWEGRLPGQPGPTVDWVARGRRAEAEREAARAIAYSRRLGLDARIESLERELQEATQTLSWRLTEPLRWLNRRRRDRSAR